MALIWHRAGTCLAPTGWKGALEREPWLVSASNAGPDDPRRALGLQQPDAPGI